MDATVPQDVPRVRPRGTYGAQRGGRAVTVEDAVDLTIENVFSNIFTMTRFFDGDKKVFIEWCQGKGLLRDTEACDCGENMHLERKTSRGNSLCQIYLCSSTSTF